MSGFNMAVTKDVEMNVGLLRRKDSDSDAVDKDLDLSESSMVHPLTHPLRQRPPVNLSVSTGMNSSGTDLHSPSMGKISLISVEQLTRLSLLLVNIMAWYYTNGMNGISMQSYAASLRERSPDGKLHGVDLSLTAVVTILQLFAGTVFGITILVALQYQQQPIHAGSNMKKFLTDTFSWTIGDLLLSSLHGIGSLATNLGFIYGSASLVQILKLIEPFETLLLTKMCSAEESKMLSVAIVSSMTTVTMAAIALVQQRKSTPHPAAVFFALCSGLALSSRNVAQRRWYAKQAKQSKSESSTAASGGASVTEVSSSNSSSYNTSESLTSAATETPVQQVQQQSPPSASTLATQQVIKSLTQFTQLSMQSGVMLAFMTLLQLVFSGNLINVLFSFSLFPSSTGSTLFISWQVFLWHPLYNVFSMITLGFCSALTHSLLNAGKRVVAIVMAIMWFHEPFSIHTVVTLGVIALGGTWYVCAVKQKSSTINKTSSSTIPPPYTTAWLLQHKYLQPILCVALLTIVYYRPAETVTLI